MKRDYVEIGGVKWATMNVGAEKETDFCLYFQHGEIQGYQHLTNLCKFIKKPKAVCDSVQAYWGDNWRMPTLEDFESLLSATTSEWITDYQGSGVSGNLFTDKTDNSKKLFFPACGLCLNGSVYYVGECGCYWSSSIYDYNVDGAWGLGFNCYNVDMGINNRCYGFVLRGVLSDK